MGAGRGACLFPFLQQGPCYCSQVRESCVGAWLGSSVSGTAAERLPANVTEMPRSAFSVAGSPVFVVFRKTVQFGGSGVGIRGHTHVSDGSVFPSVLRTRRVCIWSLIPLISGARLFLVFTISRIMMTSTPILQMGQTKVRRVNWLCWGNKPLR